ncbi:MAG: hypothetical protein LBP72_01095 [Dysgonamonadaceae bacterium]|jgi:hypothetical protein|nr:hypothetical protein [Dysgonamonadaceae bacterium]
MNKYIKVIEKDKRPVIVLAANKAFYASRGAKIEDATQKEIEAFFPEEGKGGKSKLSGGIFDRLNEEFEVVKKELEAEKAAHAETVALLNKANTELEKVRAGFDEAQRQIAKLSKNQ